MYSILHVLQLIFTHCTILKQTLSKSGCTPVVVLADNNVFAQRYVLSSSDGEKNTMSRLGCLLIVALFVVAGVTGAPKDDTLLFVNRAVELTTPASPCDWSRCKLPDCRCSSVDPPGDLPVDKIPMMVTFTFENAINAQDLQRYRQLFAGRKNPNGCPAVGTFYVSHNYTDYYAVQLLHSEGHEIGDNTVTSRGPATYWDSATYQQWKDEISSQSKILKKWAQIQTKEPVGFRVPYLEPGGDNMVAAIRDSGLQYDASRVSTKYMDRGSGFLWPYTYDYQSTQDCVAGKCPTQSYPGIWQIPLAAMEGKNGYPCASLSGCPVDNEEDAFLLLLKGYYEHLFRGAPFMITADPAWMLTDFKFNGTMKFLDLLSSQGVYLVTAQQVIEWTQQPTPVANITQFKPWGCDDLPRKVCDVTSAITCLFGKDRKLVPQGSPGVVWRMRTCEAKCPACYPWVNDPFGQSC